jgi:hypothetical protein
VSYGRAAGNNGGRVRAYLFLLPLVLDSGTRPAAVRASRRWCLTAEDLAHGLGVNDSTARMRQTGESVSYSHGSPAGGTEPSPVYTFANRSLNGF